MDTRVDGFGRRLRASALAVGTATIGVLALASQASAVNITPTSSAPTIATAINATTGGPLTTASATFDTTPAGGNANATADNASPTLPLFPRDGTTYGILTSGDPLLADDANDAPNSGTDLGGDSIRGDTDFDVTILRLPGTVPAIANPCLNFEFRFLSDEYPEFVGTDFNDAFIAELDTSDWDTSGSEITGTQNFAKDQFGNQISINATGNASVSAVNAYGTTYDGATRLLRARVPAAAGARTLLLSIFDQGDGIYDSAAFVDNVRVDSDAGCSAAAGQVSPADNPPDNSPTITNATIGPDSATFDFAPNPRSSRAPGDSFICQLHEGPPGELAGEPFESCTSPKTYTGLFEGEHTFRVAVVNAQGVPDQTPTTFGFCIGDCPVPSSPPPPPGVTPVLPAPGLAAPSNQFDVGKLKGRTLVLNLPSRGGVEVTDAAARAAGAASGSGAFAAAKKRLLKPSSVRGGPGRVTVKLRLTKVAQTLLRQKGKVKVKARITFTPDGGTANSRIVKLKVKTKKKK